MSVWLKVGGRGECSVHTRALLKSAHIGTVALFIHYYFKEHLETFSRHVNHTNHYSYSLCMLLLVSLVSSLHQVHHHGTLPPLVRRENGINHSEFDQAGGVFLLRFFFSFTIKQYFPSLFSIASIVFHLVFHCIPCFLVTSPGSICCTVQSLLSGLLFYRIFSTSPPPHPPVLLFFSGEGFPCSPC